MIKELLAKEKRALDHFFDQVDPNAIEEILTLVEKCSGKIIFTGVGKSGLIAKKIAVTMTSTGSRAYHLSPTDALHGDIGLVGEGDLFFLLSKSGESDELLNLIPFLRNKGAVPIAIVSTPQNRLVKACEKSLMLPVSEELCPFNLAPTISATVQQIFGDILTVALMHRKKFSIEDYALNHPAGKIGKRSSLKVEELMVTGEKIPLCSPKTTLAATLQELSAKQCGCVLVVDEGKKLQGIFTDGDLRRVLQKLGAKALETVMEEVMVQSPKSIGSEKLAWEALQLMEANQKSPITVLPVVKGDLTVTGLIKMHDLIQSGV